ncbi:MAG: elongation factor P, partial [Deltaproteobacteria bacterium]|nr:elongation factor P [Deltaproteobacteria bacterium]
MIAATQLRVGMTILYNGEPHRVTNVQHITPGNWRGMVQTKLKNLKTGSTAENRFRSEDKLEKAHLEQHDMEYLYNSG